MSITGLLSSGLFGASTASTQQTTTQKFKQEFQQLGQDLQAGNLSAAQSDFATLQQTAPQNSAIAGQNSNPLSQAFNQLATDLQSGNLTAAQSDFSTIRQDFQNQALQGGGGHHHHHRADSGGGSSATGQSANPISQLFTQLGTALQAGNLSAAQTAYSTLQQDFQQFAQNSGLLAATSTSGQSGIGGLSVTA